METPPARSGARAVVAVRRLFAAETSEYFMLLGTTVFITVFGLVMVLSSSSIEAGAAGGDFFSRFTRQGVFALIGVPVMLIAARLPPSFWTRWSWAILVVSVVLQMLVVFTGLGWGNGYNTNWIKIGPVTAQPSELVKFALVVWLAAILSRKRDLLTELRHLAIPIVPVVFVAIGLVLRGGDLGTAIILFAIVVAAFFFGGVRMRFVALLVAGASAAAWVLTTTSDSRSTRIGNWLDGCTSAAEAQFGCYQTLNGWYALADGGLFGAGLGNSSWKWSWVPAADNDFIFAIIGNELGLVGSVIVLLLFLLLAWCFVRVIRMQRAAFPRIVTGAVMVWIIGQAFVNIAVVLGLLPVLGLPLPLVSTGGTALVVTMAGIGVVLSFARRRPEEDSEA